MSAEADAFAAALVGAFLGGFLGSRLTSFLRRRRAERALRKIRRLP